MNINSLHAAALLTPVSARGAPKLRRIVVTADDGGGASAKKAAEDDADKDEPCWICHDDLPDVGRGILPCVSTILLD